ncbi:hypothetical protein GCM10007320_30040 [Pseudorhodoferax aquiterrae]|uniref:Uncharacterized protein n=1 Tax=Pseudorhodoferax aquiterrae TaxID=747304 RepID=A0ABQ3G2E8_9BURK|nr:hypothetical protein [Pseudorhodoferax aquiterrae]GHC85240.1 hypothetical protein GCM10007320_30040 [Pseudorhodoferax aquiterrae]
MLSLMSEQWSKLQHAYGSAADAPALLARLSSLPSSEGDAEPWFSLWSALAHQGDVYSASFAAVPHVIAALAIAPAEADASFLQFPAWVEICRAKGAVEVPEELSEAYFGSLARLPSLAALALAGRRERGVVACALSATAAAQGQHAIAEAVLEMAQPETAEQFLQWRLDQ